MPKYQRFISIIAEQREITKIRICLVGNKQKLFFEIIIPLHHKNVMSQKNVMSLFLHILSFTKVVNIKTRPHFI